MGHLVNKLVALPYGIALAVALLIVGMLGTTLLLVNAIYFVIYKKLQRLTRNIPGKIHYNWLDGPYLAIEQDGVRYKIRIKTGGEHSPPKLRVQRPNTLPFRFFLLKQNASQILGYRLFHGGRAIKTGEASLDQQIFAKSNAPIQAEKFLQSSDQRGTVRFLLEKGYEKIVARKNTFAIEKLGYSPSDFRPDELQELLSRLNRFVT